MNWEKSREVQLERHSKIIILHLFLNWETLEVQPKTNIQKSQFCIYGCPNLNFIIDNRMGSLDETGYISNFSSNFKNLSINCNKYVFH